MKETYRIEVWNSDGQHRVWKNIDRTIAKKALIATSKMLSMNLKFIIERE